MTISFIILIFSSALSVHIWVNTSNFGYFLKYGTDGSDTKEHSTHAPRLEELYLSGVRAAELLVQLFPLLLSLSLWRYHRMSARHPNWLRERTDVLWKKSAIQYYNIFKMLSECIQGFFFDYTSNFSTYQYFPKFEYFELTWYTWGLIFPYILCTERKEKYNTLLILKYLAFPTN